MSAYSDWKCGALTDEEYNSYCAWEEARDRYYEEREMYDTAYDDGDEEVEE